jgi:hypothetical protein
MSVLREDTDGVVIEELPAGAISDLLEREARDLLNMTGAQFAKKWAAGAFADTDDPRVTDLAMLLP